MKQKLFGLIGAGVILLFQASAPSGALAESPSLADSDFTELAKGTAKDLTKCKGLDGKANVAIGAFSNHTSEHIDKNQFFSALKEQVHRNTKLTLVEPKEDDPKSPLELNFKLSSTSFEKGKSWVGTYKLSIKLLKDEKEVCSQEVVLKKKSP